MNDSDDLWAYGESCEWPRPEVPSSESIVQLVHRRFRDAFDASPFFREWMRARRRDGEKRKRAGVLA